ncbi:hypothetical protein GCM10023321_37410 [Pseudonocardia eucalypti]|uniref:Helix-turn-helix domain-containing protein n=1 Tax=Pseudonocardia eucalypti TaxID=648755 RepID=A0ABP9Q7V9_9PSEU|nr:hypothetical protein [Pseudonocardia eucalypti]
MDLKEALSYPRPPVRRLLDMVKHWAKVPAAERAAASEPRFQPRRALSLAERLGEAGVQKLITAYRNGTTGPELAAEYGCSLKTIRRLLRKYGVRLAD